MKPGEIKINLKDDYMVLPFKDGPIMFKISKSDLRLNMKKKTVRFIATIDAKI